MSNLQISFQQSHEVKADISAFFIGEDQEFCSHLKQIDKDNTLLKSVKNNKKFKGKPGETLILYSPSDSLPILLIGLPKTETEQRAAGAKITKACNNLQSNHVYVCAKEQSKEFVLQVAFGMRMENYHFAKYFVQKRDEHLLYLSKATICTAHKASDDFTEYDNIVNGIFLTRDLVSKPANILYPESFVEECKYLETLGLKVYSLNEEQMKKEGMHMMLAVGQGSAKASRLLVIEHKGADESQPPVALVGKGVTFDTGGINLKPTGYIEDMKFDMAGAGGVVGAMHAIAANKLPVNVVAICGLVENMCSGDAQRPSDVVYSMSGQTVEIGNTDAEGRLVMGDCITYIQKHHKPKAIIDMATLTGAILVALGDGYAGLFSNNKTLVDNLVSCGEKTNEKLWHMPTGKYYDKMLDSEIADIKNISAGRMAGSITAAQFLQRFVQNDTPWAHLDIAAVEWNKKDKDCYPKGATGFGAYLLYEYVKQHA